MQRGLHVLSTLYCVHQPNWLVKPTPTSSACGYPPCFALRRGLPRALGLFRMNTAAVRFGVSIHAHDNAASVMAAHARTSKQATSASLPLSRFGLAPSLAFQFPCATRSGAMLMLNQAVCPSAASASISGAKVPHTHRQVVACPAAGNAGRRSAISRHAIGKLAARPSAATEPVARLQ